MQNKISSTRFTIQFNKNDPKHLRVVDELNKQERYGKAQFIVDAVIYYLDHVVISKSKFSVHIDEKYIESIVNRMLQNRELQIYKSDSYDNKPLIINHNTNNYEQPELLTKKYETLEIDDNMTEFSDDTINMIKNTLDMFKCK